MAKKISAHTTPAEIKEQEEFKNPTTEHVEPVQPILYSCGFSKFGRYWRSYTITSQGDKILDVEYGQDSPRASAQTELKIRCVKLWEKTLKMLGEI